jgi:elongation factor G
MNTTTLKNINTREFPLANTRNIGIAAHIDAGKTTLTERLLYLAGAVHKCGEVHDGSTTTDFGELERLKGITISAAAVPVEWAQPDDPGVAKLFAGARHRVNIIDTPGHVDFTAEVERSLRVLDGMVAVFDAVAGVQPQSETVWHQADKYRVPRIVFVNKMDRAGANFANVVDELGRKLGTNAFPVLWPLGEGETMRGQLDVINERAILFAAEQPGVYSVEDVPPEAREFVADQRARLVARIAEIDDEIAELWLDGRRVPAMALKRAIRRATIANRFAPVAGGSAHKFKGVQPLLDAIVDYLPSPADLPEFEARAADGGAAVRLRADDDGPLAALAFKVARDSQAGRWVFARVYSGTIRKGDMALNPRTGKSERIARIARVVANRREEMPVALAGDIVVLGGLRGFTTGDTLCREETPLWLEPPVFPEPVVSMAIEPRAAADRERLAVALARLSDEDPTFRSYTHPETGQTIIAGMGELHLEIARERLARDHGVEANAGAPEIAYRETVRDEGRADHLLKKQNGGAGQYARVALRVLPNAPGGGLTVENRVAGGSIPERFIAAVRKGIGEALEEGVLGGYPTVDARVEILDGASHVKDSNDQAFRSAAWFATKEALRRAGPVLLEPVMKVEISSPVERQGDLLGDLLRRRGKALGSEAKGNGVLLHAEAPMAELFGYADAIRSLSRGRAACGVTLDRFEPAPPAVATRVLGDRKRA